MGRQDLTIEVLNLSPKLTLSDLNICFSYCGTVDKIQLRKTKDKSQSALVTFRQPYAFQTALLLNGATFAGQPIRVLPSEDVVIPITSANKSIDKTQVPHPSQFFGNTKHEGHDLFPALQAAVQDAASKGIKMLKAEDEIEENFKLPEKGRTLVDRTTLAINGYVSSSAAWFSGLLDKTSSMSQPWELTRGITPTLGNRSKAAVLMKYDYYTIRPDIRTFVTLLIGIPPEISVFHVKLKLHN